ncbi:MAG: copper homeostasis protein CutC [Planctomycetaceae bacterium]|jgi:copper homeostasis protein
MLVEICCGSLDDALAAEAGGADRIELNSALFLGGLTPSAGTIRLARARLSIPILAMVRPRGGGFLYSDAEFDVMQADAQALCDLGADGLVFGCLTAEGVVDRERTARLVELAGGRPTVFHRAFDVVPDPFAALETLISLGITRVLTSGQEESAYNGAALIRQLRDAARGRIEILPGGGIDPFNIADVVARTGTDQVHLALFAPRLDPSCQGRPQVFFGGGLRPAEDQLDVIDAQGVARLRSQLRGS